MNHRTQQVLTGFERTGHRPRKKVQTKVWHQAVEETDRQESKGRSDAEKRETDRLYALMREQDEAPSMRQEMATDEGDYERTASNAFSDDDTTKLKVSRDS